nr:retrovirus-related Pol polyprotein from transposon TNT 1-94 [Tanacetum cinerariifolium]
MKLKGRLKSLSGNVKEEKIKRGLEEIETINIELDHRVTKLVAENKHLKQIYKQLYGSIKSSRVRSKEQYKPVVTLVYSRKSEAAKKKVPARNSKIHKSLVVQIVLWYMDFRCSKNMTEDRSQLISFVQKFLGTVKFRNDHVAKIMGYGDYKIRKTWKSLFANTLVSFAIWMASKTKSWLWHRCLSHLNIGAINHLARQGLVREVVATACYTQNRSIIRLRHGKTSYELLHNKLPDLSFLYVFGALCYPTNDSENLGKLQPKADIGIFIGYAPTKKAFWIYNRHTRRIVETIHVDFDELTAMAFEQSSSGPALNEITPATISSRLVQNPSSSTPYVPPSRNDWDLLFQPMFNELLNPPPSVDPQALEVIALIVEVIPPVQADLTGLPFSTTVDQNAPSPSKSQTTPETQSAVIPQDVEEDNIDIEVAHMRNDPLYGVPIPEVTSAQSSSMTTPETQSAVIPQDVEEDNIDIEVAHMGNDPLYGVPIPEVTSAQSSSMVSPHTIVQPDHQIP